MKSSIHKQICQKVSNRCFKKYKIYISCDQQHHSTSTPAQPYKSPGRDFGLLTCDTVKYRASTLLVATDCMEVHALISLCCELNHRAIDDMYNDQHRAFTESYSCSIVHVCHEWIQESIKQGKLKITKNVHECLSAIKPKNSIVLLLHTTAILSMWNLKEHL